MLILIAPIDPAGRELSGGAWKSSRTFKIINFQRFFIILHCFSLFLLCFLLFFAAVDGLGWCGDGPDVVGNEWEGLVLLGGVYFYISFQVLRLIG